MKKEERSNTKKIVKQNASSSIQIGFMKWEGQFWFEEELDCFNPICISTSIM